MTRRLADAQGYRRGMVLGLTMAEIMLLLVFLLLLAASALLFRREGARQALRDQRDRQATAAAVGAALQARLDTQVGQINALQAVLHETRTAAAQADAARAGVATQLAAQARVLQAQTRELSAARSAAQGLAGQNTQMRGELARVHGNAGSGLPYCWTTPDGRPVTALRVQLRDGGVVVHEPEPRPRPGDAAWDRLATVPRGVQEPIERFMAQAAPFIAQSDNERCRYAVDVIDATGPANKSGYKRLMNRLWGSFLLHEVGG